MPGITRRSRSAPAQPVWLGSTHGIRSARSGHAPLANFDESDHYPQGKLLGGVPVDASNEADLKPFTGGEGEQLGFILWDENVTEDDGVNVAVLRHGIVKTAQLPVEFTAPDGGVGNFTFITGTEEEGA